MTSHYFTQCSLSTLTSHHWARMSYNILIFLYLYFQCTPYGSIPLWCLCSQHGQQCYPKWLVGRVSGLKCHNITLCKTTVTPVHYQWYYHSHHCAFWRCDMAFIEPMHRNKPNITYLLTVHFVCSALVPISEIYWRLTLVSAKHFSMNFCFKENLYHWNSCAPLKLLFSTYDCCTLPMYCINISEHLTLLNDE